MPNITIKIDDEELIRAAKLLAAKRGISLSKLVRDWLMSQIEVDKDYEAAKRRAIASMDAGLPIGEPLRREEIYRDRVD